MAVIPVTVDGFSGHIAPNGSAAGLTMGGSMTESK
jgi:hypothetical protein